MLMCRRVALLLLLAGGLSPVGEVAAQRLISTNLYAYGRAWEEEWNQESWRETVRLDPADADRSAGFWETTAWENVSATAASATLTADDGLTTATFLLNSARNASPHWWTRTRDTANDLDGGNASLLDGKGVGTEWDNANSTGAPFPTQVYDFEVTNIPFAEYDVVVYLGYNDGQKFNRRGRIRINGQIPATLSARSGGWDFTIPSGEPDGTLDEISSDGDTGNFVVYRGLTGPTFHAQVWGEEVTHLGVAGFQIAEVPPPGAPQITAVDYDESSDDITLAWTSTPGETYGLQWSTDLVTFYPDVHQSISAHPTDPVTSFGPFPCPLPGASQLFLRVAPPDTTPPRLLSMGGEDTEVILRFSEPLLPGSATDPANYVLTGPVGGQIPVLAAEIGPTPDTIRLTLGASLEEGANYLVTVNNITDPAGFLIAPDSQAGLSAGTSILITELMASNGTNIHNNEVLLDEDGDSSDWIELYNPTAAPVNLDGWFLTDDGAVPTKWRLPAVTINPGSHLVVFASDKDRAEPDGPLHTNFNLSAGGEFLALVEPDGATVASGFAPEFPSQVTGLSYGLVPGTADEFLFLDDPTPGHPNAATGYLGLVDDTEFSVDRGFHENAIDVAITSATSGATIRYTLDMSEPTLTNGATLAPGATLPVTTTSCLRARAFKSGWLPSNIDTQTYLFPADILSQPEDPPGFPDKWRFEPADYDMDPTVIGRYSFQELDDALRSLPSISIVTDMDHLFDDETGLYDHPFGEGPLWERPASMEWIDPSGGPEIQVNCGLRMQGNAARFFKKKPFRLLFKTIYGPSKLEFSVFSEFPGAADRFDTITLRSNSQGLSYGARTQITDENGRRTLADVGTPQSHGTHVHLYVNGLYWGLYNAVERPQASFCANYFGGAKEDWDVNNGSSAIDGSYDPFETMRGQVQGGPPDNTAYHRIQGNGPDGNPDPAIPAYLDMDNYIDYMLTNFYLGTGDWAANESQGSRNYYCGRRRSDDSPGYHWFIWDAERSLQPPIPTSVSYGPAEPYAWLRGNGEFRLRFADHAQRHLRNEGALTPDRRIAAYNTHADQVRAAIICEEARWDLTTVGIFENEITDRTNNWFPGRSTAVLEHLRAENLFPSLDPPVFSQHGGSVTPTTPVTLSTTADRIHFTLDGSDPRLFGGAPAPGAFTVTFPPGGGVSDPLTFDQPTILKARARDSTTGEWSALNEAFFSIDSEPATAANLVISEIHYHPAEPTAPAELAVSQDRDDYEFIELTNVGPKTIDLTGLLFSDGITYALADRSLLPSGARLLLVKDLEAYTARYGTPAPDLVTGAYEGRLSNGGETLTLQKTGSGVLHSIPYEDQAPWPPTPDGNGPSLQLLNPETAPDHALPSNWTASSTTGGTPGGP